MSDSIPTSTQPFKENKRKLAALWLKTSNSGGQFMTGELELKNINGSADKIEVILLKTQSKSSDKAPDYELLLSKGEMEKRFKSQAGGLL